MGLRAHYYSILRTKIQLFGLLQLKNREFVFSSGCISSASSTLNYGYAVAEPSSQMEKKSSKKTGGIKQERVLSCS
jgi:hypothetical protein